MPLVGAGVSAYDTYRLHSIASTGAYGGQNYDNPDVRTLALMGSFVNGADTLASLAELVFDIPSSGTASIAMLGVNIGFAVAELGMDLMIDYYSTGTPPPQMPDWLKEGIRGAGQVCCALDPSVSFSEIYESAAQDAGQGIGLDIESQKGQSVTAETQQALLGRLQGATTDITVANAALVRNMIDEFNYSSSQNQSLAPDEFGRIVGREFISQALDMLLSSPGYQDQAYVDFLIEASLQVDAKFQSEMLSKVIESKHLFGALLVDEIADRFGLELGNDGYAERLQTLIDGPTLGKLSPAIQSSLIELLVFQNTDKLVDNALKFFKLGDDAVKKHLLESLPQDKAAAFIAALDQEGMDWIKAQQTKDPDQIGGLLEKLTAQAGGQAAIDKLVAIATPQTQVLILEKMLNAPDYTDHATELLLKITDPAILTELPLELCAQKLEGENFNKVLNHLAGIIPNSPAIGRFIAKASDEALEAYLQQSPSEGWMAICSPDNAAHLAGLMQKVSAVDATKLGNCLSQMIRNQSLPPETFQAFVGALDGDAVVSALNQLGAASDELLSQLDPEERMALFQKVVLAHGSDTLRQEGMKFARKLLNVPDLAFNADGTHDFRLPSNYKEMIAFLSTPEVLDICNGKNGGGEIMSWVLAFGDRAGADAAFAHLNQSDSWLKDNSDIIVSAFDLAKKANIPDSLMAGKLSAQALYQIMGPLNSGSDAMWAILGSTEWTQDKDLMRQLAHLTDPEGRAAIINGLLDCKTYDLGLISWNSSDINTLIGEIYNGTELPDDKLINQPSAELLSHLKPEHLASQFPDQLGAALKTLAVAGKDDSLAAMIPQLSNEQIAALINELPKEVLAGLQQSIPGLMQGLNKLLYSDQMEGLDESIDTDHALMMKLAEAASPQTKLTLLNQLMTNDYNNQIVVDILTKLPANEREEVLKGLDIATLTGNLRFSPELMPTVLDVLEKSDQKAQTAAFMEQLPAEVILASLAQDAGLKDFVPSGDLGADVTQLLEKLGSKGLNPGYDVTPHLEKLFRDLKQDAVNATDLKALADLASRVPADSRLKLIQIVLKEMILDGNDIKLIDTILTKSTDADFKRILNSLTPEELKKYGRELSYVGQGTMLTDTLGHLGEQKLDGALEQIVAGANKDQLVAAISALSDEKKQALFAKLSDKQFQALGEALIDAGSKASLELLETMITPQDAFKRQNPALRTALINHLAEKIGLYDESDGGAKALSWIIALADTPFVEKAFTICKQEQGWFNDKSDLVFEAVKDAIGLLERENFHRKLSSQEPIPLENRLSAETIRAIMPTLNNSYDFFKSWFSGDYE
ncbi:MAG: hypothetical protein ACAI44_11375, partial [Candidatus Sericytochromatia bacterium]